MKVCQFNFNNEVDTFTIHVDEETGAVTVPGEGDQVLAEYASVQQLAEIYAQARDVKPENLKNWVLVENGSVYSFVLRAGTAGVDVAEVEERLEGVFTELAGRHHALSIARAKEQIMADGTADLVDVLVHCTETEVARDVYDAMVDVIDGTPVEEEVPAEPEDTRSELEKYIDELAETQGALAFIASLVGLGADVEKAQLLQTLETSVAFSNPANIRAIYDNALLEAKRDGIGVNTDADALTVITQTAAGAIDEEMKNRMVTGARMARRNAVNVSVDIVGQRHIRHTAEMVALDELEGLDLLVRDNVPYVIRFSETIDGELEAERNAQLNAGSENDVRVAPHGEPDGSYENDYIPDEEDDYDDEEEL